MKINRMVKKKNILLIITKISSQIFHYGAIILCHFFFIPYHYNLEGIKLSLLPGLFPHCPAVGRCRHQTPVRCGWLTEMY